MAAWASSAGQRSSFLSAALDHRRAAEFLLKSKLVRSAPNIMLSPRLKALSERADRPTLTAIARVLLELAPPPWLFVAVDKQVRYEFVPSNDLRALDWLRPELDQLLLDAAFGSADRPDLIARGLGRAAELTVFAALQLLDASPIHVADISDRFGYDIETARGPVRRWEVKGATRNTSDSFHLSRNEFDQGVRHPVEWQVIQVEFASNAFTAEWLTASHVSRIRELSVTDLLMLTPPETDSFHWESGARITPPGNMWSRSTLTAPTDMQIPSIIELGKQAHEIRTGVPSP
jgi:hypothetical protein